MKPDAAADRYRSRIEELSSLKGELETPKRPGDPAPVVGRVLEAAGDLLRRTKAIPCDLGALQTTLALVPGSGLRSWGEAVSVEDLQARLKRAADEAVEAALPDTPDDGSTWTSWAMQGLFARDRMESALCAVQHLAQQGRKDAAELHARLSAAVLTVDKALAPRAAWLTPLNAGRRAEAGMLDPEARLKAWWFTARSETPDDGLVAALGGEGGRALDGAEAKVHAEVTRARRRAVSYDELFRYDLGLASPAERASIAAQSKENPDFARAMAALVEGERAIEELAGPVPELKVIPIDRAPSGRIEPGKGELIAERPEFKVLLFRRKERVQLVVQPQRKDR
ncbi:MAG: hypothetical protein H6Q89_4342, partial [Myxococcaceae bacterium]|nr:hypothetical protein [Myxococcaceae bacterium]